MSERRCSRSQSSFWHKNLGSMNRTTLLLRQGAQRGREMSKLQGLQVRRRLFFLPGSDNLQSIILKDTLHLVASMSSPRTSGVQLYISLPMLQRLAWFFNLLVSQCQIVMRIGICRGQMQCGLISLYRLAHSPSFIEH